MERVVIAVVFGIDCGNPHALGVVLLYSWLGVIGEVEISCRGGVVCIVTMIKTKFRDYARITFNLGEDLK